MKFLIAGVACLMALVPARAQQDLGPEELVRKVTQDVLDAIRSDRQLAAGGKPLPVDYAMHKTAEGWKIYDITVEGVSLVLTYRSEFDAIVKQEGIDGLIKRLEEKNTPAKLG